MGMDDKRCKSLEEDKRVTTINDVPDELLVSIISFLTIEEAARTSVLSHRWENLWNYYTGSVIFNFPLYPGQEKSKFVSKVNRILSSLHESSTLDAFIMRCDSSEDLSCHFDRWVEFALEKEIVHKLELNMALRTWPGRIPPPTYTFSSELFNRIKEPHCFYSVSALTSLSFINVNVSGDIVDCFISNCRWLEQLTLEQSSHLKTLKVRGASLKLICLEIYSCSCLESVDISAPNLESFHYFGQLIKLNVENAPKLLEVSLGYYFRVYMSCSISNYFSQLETLTLYIKLVNNEEFTHSIKFNKLKHLILPIDVYTEESILGLTSMIEAAPFLEKLTVELLMFSVRNSREIQIVNPTSPHPCLKVFKINGFLGRATDAELVIYILANCPSLEKITIVRGSKERVAAKKYALYLREKYLPPGVDFLLD